MAEEDLIAAVRFYAQEGGRELGERVFDAALAALKPVQEIPALG